MKYYKILKLMDIMMKNQKHKHFKYLFIKHF